MCKKMLISLLAYLAVTCLANEETIDLGDSPEKLIAVEGQPNEIVELETNGKVFVTYYYKKTNLSYVIDKAEDIVCEVAFGKTEGACYPCDFGPVAGSCP